MFSRLNRIRYRNQTNSPYLSGDSFASLADFRISRNQDFSNLLSNLSNSFVLFCKSELVEPLIALISKREGNYRLIAGNSDRNFSDIPIGLRDSFEKSFLQNSTISDNQNIFTLPIGIENLRLGVNGLPRNMKSGTPWMNRYKSVLIGPYSITNTNRKDLLSDKGLAQSEFTICDVFMSPKAYSNLVQQHKFVLCPAGNGIDTHRFWETLYRGAVPIVLNTFWSQSLKLHRIPMVEVSQFTSETILESVKEFEKRVQPGFNPRQTEALWIDYWKSFLRK